MNILKIAIDGIHRSWKWTQIWLLEKRLDHAQVNHETIRWAHYRNWDWNHRTDPHSPWRQKNKYKNNYAEKEKRLLDDIIYFYRNLLIWHLNENNLNNCTIIQDRSIAGTCLFNYSLGLKNNKELINNYTIPDLIFILQPSKESIIDRIKNDLLTNIDRGEWEINKMRILYKKEYIENNYDKYYEWIWHLPSEIKNNIIHITYNKNNYISPEIIDAMIWENIISNPRCYFREGL